MIDLFSIKLNGDYDFIQDSLPETDGRWLVSETFSIYTKGESYDVLSSVATRIEKTLDFKINRLIYPTIYKVCSWLNNFFYIYRQNRNLGSETNNNIEFSNLSIRDKRDYFAYTSTVGDLTFSNGTVTGLEDHPFKTDDLVEFRNFLRNNFVSYIEVDGNNLELDNSTFSSGDDSGMIMLMDLDENVENAISGMIYYDVSLRGNPNILSDEWIGNYRYKQDNTEIINIGGIHYPSLYVGDLLIYRKFKFIQ